MSTNTVKAAYEAYRDFPKEREALWQRHNTEASSGDNLAQERDRLRNELKQVTLEYKAKLAEIDLKMAKQGLGPTMTQRRRDFDAKMRLEKERRLIAFRNAVVQAHKEGETVHRIMQMCGANSPSTFYNIVKNHEIMSEATPQTVAVPDGPWKYSDHTAVHRYAFNADHSVLKVHGDDGEVAYYTWPDLDYIAGSTAITAHRKRADMLEAILNDTFDRPQTHTPNPYKES